MALAGIRYRDATPRDATALGALVSAGYATYRAFAPDGWQPRGRGREEAEIHTRLSRGGTRSRIAISGEDTRIAGIVTWSPALTPDEPREPIGGRAHLSSLFVAERWWGTGLATELLTWSTRGMRDSGFATAQLWTPAAHGRARSFYEREGWRVVPSSEMTNRELGLELVMYEIELG